MGLLTGGTRVEKAEVEASKAAKEQERPMVRHGWQILIRQKKARKAREKVVWRELAK